jgi:hypothetical protein
MHNTLIRVVADLRELDPVTTPISGYSRVGVD